MSPVPPARVLVDTSVWVAHFRQGSAVLNQLLADDAVLMHPLALGELACGTPPRRRQTLRDLALLPSARQASLEEVLAFIERRQLYGLGCGLVDVSLLASALLTPGAALWTLDARLAAQARRLGVLYLPAH